MIKNKYNKIQNIRRLLRNNAPCVGTFIQLSDPNSLEIISDNNYSWIALDLEHGNINISNLSSLVRVVENSKSLPIVRLGSSSEYECKKVLESGAAGVIVPMVKNVIQLTKIYNYCAWPPKGHRGVGYSRANLYGKYFNDYQKYLSQKPLFIAMVENKECLDNLSELMQLDFVDAFFIGPYDLSASLNVTGNFKNKLFLKSIDNIKRLSKKYKKPIGIHLIEPNNKKLKKIIKEGFSFVAYSLDTVFIQHNSYFKI